MNQTAETCEQTNGHPMHVVRVTLALSIISASCGSERARAARPHATGARSPADTDHGLFSGSSDSCGMRLIANH